MKNYGCAPGSDYIMLNYRMIIEWWKRWNEPLWTDWRYYCGICLEELRKTIKVISHDNQSSGYTLTQDLLNTRENFLPLSHQCSVISLLPLNAILNKIYILLNISHHDWTKGDCTQLACDKFKCATVYRNAECLSEWQSCSTHCFCMTQCTMATNWLWLYK